MKYHVRHKRGYTLIELVVAVAAGTILLGGMTSALFLATQSLEMPEHLSAMQTASDVAFDLADELQHTIYITERTSTAVEFVLTDMTGDGQPDVVRYEWSGTPGDPLQRTFNHGTAETVAENVQEFDLEYGVRSKTEEFGVTLQESSTVILSELTTGPTEDFPVDAADWPGQFFTADLPADAVSWSLTEVELELRKDNSATGKFHVQLRPATGSGAPASTVLEEVLVNESSLQGLYKWQLFTFNSITNQSPSQGLCIVLEPADTPPTGMQRRVTEGVSLADHAWLETNDQGASWKLGADQGMRFKVRGTYTSPTGTTQTVTRKYLTGVRITLRLGADGNSRIHTSTPLLNTPERLAHFWELQFDRDPTTVDADHDGAGDWAVRDGSSFDTSTLTDGVWHADSSLLDTAPGNDFTQLTTVNVRFRNTTVGGDGARFAMNYDFSGSDHAAVHAKLQNIGGSQTLKVFKKTDPSTSVELVRVNNLPTDFVDLRLVLDPTQDVVGVKVNGTDMGAFTNLPFFESTTDRFATIYESGSDAEFDYVSIRISDND